MNPVEALNSAKMILESSGLSSTDKELWLSRLSHAAADVVNSFVEMFRDDQSDLERSTYFLRMQLEAHRNPSVLPSLIADQKAEIAQAFEKAKSQ